VIGAATQSPDGGWTKSDPYLQPEPSPTFLADGVAEPSMAIGPDGAYYLFFAAALGTGQARVTGLARATSLTGPWDIDPEPALSPAPGQGVEACGTFSPSVLIESQRVRLWYLAVDDCQGSCPSCDFAACNCNALLSTGYAEASWPLYSP
jgi:hypothetical protein